MKKLFLFLLLSLVIPNSYSCDCSEKPSIEKNWELASEIFTAKIIKVDSLLYGNYGEKLYSFTITINKSYKEEIFEERKNRTILFTDGGSCDFPFLIGEEYLIYAKSNNYTLNCSICSRTNLLSNVDEKEFVTLEKLHKNYIKNKGEIRIIKFQNHIQYQIDLVKNSFEEKLKTKDKIIYGLSLLSFLLFILLIIIIKRK
ncbi:hypothetical protein [Flavobacterium limi]|uniref:Tissue inhibitor of metalloproteinase n=1 Tax=Flavobacterium limi TaxID=2045105 RepID=A0ABQ1TRM3_9FLAO|nr:hypothetical protein [Flavobacterium limi]GGF01268.1 hypothetical protein GCM10011518_08390 [Flavobacterium limi]